MRYAVKYSGSEHKNSSCHEGITCCLSWLSTNATTARLWLRYKFCNPSLFIYLSLFVLIDYWLFYFFSGGPEGVGKTIPSLARGFAWIVILIISGGSKGVVFWLLDCAFSPQTGNLSHLSSVSHPSRTWPKTVCILSKCGCCSYKIKNCDCMYVRIYVFMYMCITEVWKCDLNLNDSEITIRSSANKYKYKYKYRLHFRVWLYLLCWYLVLDWPWRVSRVDHAYCSDGIRRERSRHCPK